MKEKVYELYLLEMFGGNEDDCVTYYEIFKDQFEEEFRAYEHIAKLIESIKGGKQNARKNQFK